MRLAEIRAGRELGRIAEVPVGIAGGEYEDRLLAGAGLGERGDGVAVTGPELLLAVLVDDAEKAHAHVHEIERAATA